MALEREYMSINEVTKIVPYGKSSIYEKMKTGEFPRQISMGPRKVVWKIAEVKAWLKNWEAQRTLMVA